MLMLAPVRTRDVHLLVDATIVGETISGRVSGTGFEQTFRGRLGLMSAIENAFAEPSDASHPRSTS